MSRVAVLGPGGVGGALAARLAAAGLDVTCVASPETAAAIRSDGLTLQWRGQTIKTKPQAVERLTDPVDLVLITTKATALGVALGRIDASAVANAVILPLLNGLEHLEPIRARLGARVAAGSVRIEAFRESRTLITQRTEYTLVRMASHELTVSDLNLAAAFLDRAEIATRVDESEREVLWEKVVRMAPLAAVTAISQEPVGAVLADATLRERLWAGLWEACAVAAADGVETDPEAQWAVIESLAPTLRTSASRDVAAGKPSELDAIAGSVVRAGQRLGVATPTLAELVAEASRTAA